MTEKRKTEWIDIRELVSVYIPVSKRKARKFVELYCSSRKYVGGRIYVERAQLEQLLADPERESFPLDI